MKKILLVCAVIALVSSCKKDKNNGGPATGGVYIVNEGNFNFGTADVSVYDPQTNTVTNEVFSNANGYSLGDVAQSMYVKDSTGYIVVNNSAKIEVVRLPSFKGIQTISIPGSSPRCFLPVNDSIAYVSELYAKKIWVLNYLTGSVVSTITTTGWTEKMLLLNGHVYVQQKIASNVSNSENRLLRISTQFNAMTDSYDFGKRDVTGLDADGQGRIWVSIDEDSTTNAKTALVCFDQSFMPAKTLMHTSFGHHFSQICIHPSTGKIVYADGDLLTANVNDATLSNQIFVPKAGKNIYTIALNPANGDVYASDALDFVQRSRIYRYDINGNEIHSFTGGIISGNFTFNE